MTQLAETDDLLDSEATTSALSPRKAPPTLTIISLLIGAAFAAPLAYIAWRNLTLGSDLWAEVSDPAVIAALGRSALLATVVSVTAAGVGTTMAWLTTRTDLPMRRVWRVLAPLPLIYPSFVGAAAMVAAFDTGGLVERWLEPLGVGALPEVEGFWATWLVLTLFTFPFVYLPVAARLRTLPPSLEESARLLGSSPGRVFRTVVLPQTAPSIWAGSLLVFLYTLSDFGVVDILRYDTLTREIYANRVYNQPRAMALALLLGIFAVLVVTAERMVNRHKPVSETSGEGRSHQVVLGHWRWPAFAFMVVLLGNALLGPMLSLAWWASRGLANEGWGHLGQLMSEVTQPAFNSAWISVISAVIAVVAVLPVAYLIARHKTRSGGLANAFVVGGFALPGLAVALAMVFWALNTPGASAFYQSFFLLVFAYVVHFGAQSMRASQVAVAAVPTRLEDAARTLGASRWRRLLTLELPLMAPGLLAGGGLVLLSVMKELPATLMLAPIGFKTLAIEIWTAREDALFAEMGTASIVLVILSGFLTWLLVIRRAESY